MRRVVAAAVAGLSGAAVAAPPAAADLTVCPMLGSLAPGVPRAVDVSPEGDVYVSGGFVWDCPPFSD